MNRRYKPISVDVNHSDQILKIKWDDSHISRFPLFGLRKNCPCVTCRGGHENMGSFEPELFRVDPPYRLRILNAEPVGNHALKIHWDDGHSSGMYQWELLRRMSEAMENLP